MNVGPTSGRNVQAKLQAELQEVLSQTVRTVSGQQAKAKPRTTTRTLETVKAKEPILRKKVRETKQAERVEIRDVLKGEMKGVNETWLSKQLTQSDGTLKSGQFLNNKIRL